MGRGKGEVEGGKEMREGGGERGRKDEAKVVIREEVWNTASG